MKEIEVIYDFVMGTLGELSIESRVELQKKLAEVQSKHGLSAEGAELLIRLEKLNGLKIMDSKVVSCRDFEGKGIVELNDEEIDLLRENGLCGICEKTADCKKWVKIYYNSEENYFVARNRL